MALIAEALSCLTPPCVAYVLGLSPKTKSAYIQEVVYELIENGLDYYVARNKRKTYWFLYHHHHDGLAGSLLGYNSFDLHVTPEGTLQIRGEEGIALPRWEKYDLPPAKPLRWLLVDAVTAYCYPRLFILPRYIPPIRQFVGPIQFPSWELLIFRKVDRLLYEEIYHFQNGDVIKTTANPQHVLAALYGLLPLSDRMGKLGLEITFSGLYPTLYKENAIKPSSFFPKESQEANILSRLRDLGEQLKVMFSEEPEENTNWGRVREFTGDDSLFSFRGDEMGPDM